MRGRVRGSRVRVDRLSRALQVLDGVKQLVAAGSVQLPLPRTLSELLDKPAGQLVMNEESS